MKAPEKFMRFASFEEQIQKYKEWDFPTGRKNQLPELLYKGVFFFFFSEKCSIIGYTDMVPDEMVIVIHLSESNKDLQIDRRYLKQMQLNKFRLDENDESFDNSSQNKQKTGKELNELMNDYVVYDIETTGLNSKTDEIIEIAAIRIKNGKIVDEYDSLVCPNIDIPNRVTKLTGITDLMVSNAKSINTVILEFMEFIGEDIVVGHNIKTFDNHFIARFNSGCFSNDYIDTLFIAKKLYPELNTKKISTLIEYLNIDSTEPQHRALNDCRYEYKIYELMKKNIIEQFGSAKRFFDYYPITKAKTKSAISKTNKYPKYEDLRQLNSSNTVFNENHPFYNKSCVFTGELKKYSREEAAQLVVDVGGRCENNVTKKTNFLIVSNGSDTNKKSGKQKKAEEYKSKGQDIEIISESVFYNMINGD